MFIPLTIKMNVILVFLLRFYTIRKNVRTHIKSLFYCLLSCPNVIKNINKTDHKTK